VQSHLKRFHPPSHIQNFYLAQESCRILVGAEKFWRGHPWHKITNGPNLVGKNKGLKCVCPLSFSVSPKLTYSNMLVSLWYNNNYITFGGPNILFNIKSTLLVTFISFDYFLTRFSQKSLIKSQFSFKLYNHYFAKLFNFSLFSNDMIKIFSNYLKIGK